jgi:1-aminocyclopropane-1-carboxylate deaminase/D-cysteine desulfhydrase-like pyridoxal-dependent ACC family enzyme
MKRLIAAVIAGLVTFGGIYGLAASLNLTTDSLGAADTVVAACQATAMNATYTSSYSAATPGYNVGTVTVTGLAAGCYSKAYKITLSTAANASLGEATGSTPSSGTSFSATFSPSVSAAAVTGIAVVISG